MPREHARPKDADVTEPGGTLIFNSKQLEELESIHDSTGAFEEESDDAGMEDVGEAAMEWRRGLLEEAAENVKRAKGRPVDPNIIYDAGSLLYDRESRRFGRVNRSVPGYLRIVYLTGGDREYGLLDVASYLKEFAAVKKVSELARQLGMPDVDVERELDRLDLTALEEEPSEVDGAAVEGDAALADANGAPAVEAPASKADKKGDKKAKGQKAKPEPKKAEKVSAKPAKADKKAKADDDKKAKGKKAPPPPPAKKGGKKANPIDDPNAFIRQNFQEMSNRELARHTGLSEHTIRRKLGEWGLKRKKA
jgi:hypothetical protein